MRVIGIDASTNYSGICVMEDDELIDYQLLDCHKIKDADQRICEMLHKMISYMETESHIDKIVMEESILKSNISTTKMLSYIMGGVMLYASYRSVVFERVLPSQWRAKVGIKQNNDIKREKLKQEAVKMVEEMFGITVSDDISEAILICRSAFINNK